MSFDPPSCNMSTATIAHANIALADLPPAMPLGYTTSIKSRLIPISNTYYIIYY